MAHIRKAARGKRRWVGVKIDKKNIEENDIPEISSIDSGKPRIAWRSPDGKFLILEVTLESHKEFIEAVRKTAHLESITSSGKIRLVKSRISQLT